MGITAAFLTAFYSWRLLFLVFHGNNRSDHHTFDHAHESPKIMLIPLFVLAIGSVLSGLYGAKILNIVSATNNFFDSVIYVGESKIDLLEEIHHAPFLVKISPMIVGILAISLAYLFYVRKNNFAEKLANKFKILYQISLNKWYFDELYQTIFINAIKKLGSFLWKFFDIKIVDGIPNSMVFLTKKLSLQVSKLQTGLIYNYALAMVLGMVAILFFFITYLKHILSF
jgi:NADH-quinone oxidoreductase subunit L